MREERTEARQEVKGKEQKYERETQRLKGEDNVQVQPRQVHRMRPRTNRPNAAGFEAAFFSGTKAEEQRDVAANVPCLYASGVGSDAGRNEHSR